MLTAEIKINGKLLGHLYIVNKGYVGNIMDSNRDSIGLHAYDYEYFEIGSNKKPKIGKVTHSREAGPLTLIRICTEDMGL